jgi:hypothetical protein
VKIRDDRFSIDSSSNFSHFKHSPKAIRMPHHKSIMTPKKLMPLPGAPFDANQVFSATRKSYLPVAVRDGSNDYHPLDSQ